MPRLESSAPRRATPSWKVCRLWSSSARCRWRRPSRCTSSMSRRSLLLLKGDHPANRLRPVANDGHNGHNGQRGAESSSDPTVTASPNVWTSNKSLDGSYPSRTHAPVTFIPRGAGDTGEATVSAWSQRAEPVVRAVASTSWRSRTHGGHEPQRSHLERPRRDGPRHLDNGDSRRVVGFPFHQISAAMSTRMTPTSAVPSQSRGSGAPRPVQRMCPCCRVAVLVAVQPIDPPPVSP